jgi:nitrite reductase/ring-hydroxylating ferredoxin subunit
LKIAVFPADDLAPGQMRSVEVDGVSVVVIRRGDGAYRALRDRCSHQGGALSQGQLESLVEGDAPGQYRLSEDRAVVRCPLHHFEFDVDSGLSPADPKRLRVRAYDVTVSDGNVYVER